ncbi:MAG TPA: GntR family transcriptional regulator [Streptomyces sp.]|nr:GntR family transcriptional regulator [Streptomyces sp.]
MTTDAEWAEPEGRTELADDRALLGRASTAERVADVLRTRIAEGFFPPGTRLSEGSIGGALGISRNTLRESFRLLTHERLLTHQLNKGVFVRVLTVDEVLDIYRMRKLIECGVIRGLAAQSSGARACAPGALGAPDGLDGLVGLDELVGLDGLGATVAAGQAAAQDRRWADVATANIHFHHELVALGRSPRTDEVMRSVLAELRLTFHVMDSPRRLHEPYLARNQEILETLRSGDTDKAERMLGQYLDDSRDQIVAAYAQRIATGA